MNIIGVGVTLPIIKIYHPSFNKRKVFRNSSIRSKVFCEEAISQSSKKIFLEFYLLQGNYQQSQLRYIASENTQ